MEFLKRSFVVKVTDDLELLNGEEFERFARYILELILGDTVIHKGQNLYAKPVKNTADFNSNDFKIIGQCGTDPKYFEDFTKPIADIIGGLRSHKSCEEIYLFANRYAGTSRFDKLSNEIKTAGISQKVHPYDTQKIGEAILSKINVSDVSEKIMAFLPSAFELYKILPQTNVLPSHKSLYYSRTNEENNLIEIIKKERIVQLYGISGIGKSELTIAIANELRAEYHTCLWIDELENKERIDFNAIKTSKFDSKINLATILRTYKALLIFDNVNENLADIIQQFESNNKNDSRLVVSSILQTLPSESSYKVQGVEKTIAESILFSIENKPTSQLVDQIVEYTGGHPLILNIIKALVDVQSLSWAEISKELQNIKDVHDTERNQAFSNRIIGQLLPLLNEELAFLKYIDNRKINKSFIREILGPIKLDKLIRASLLNNLNTKTYIIHQLVLDSIIKEVSADKYIQQFNAGLISFLEKGNEEKTIDFFHFLFAHRNILWRRIEDSQLSLTERQITIYSLLQSIDIRTDPKVNALINICQAAIKNNSHYYDDLLRIEINEIQITNIDRSDVQRYTSLIKTQISELEKMVISANDINHKATILHHLGKLFFHLEEYDQALSYFDQVLAFKLNDPYALLQKARIYDRKKIHKKVEEATDIVLSLDTPPLSIWLAFYELISKIEYTKIKEKHVGKQIEKFTYNLIEAIDSKYDQPYRIISRLGDHICYNYPDYYDLIIANLPLPSNINLSDSLKFDYACCQASYYTFLKYAKSSMPNEEFNVRQQQVFEIAKSYFENSKLDSPFKRGKYVDLLIEAGRFDDALNFHEKESTATDEFWLQKVCKIYIGKKDYETAIAKIDEAIALHTKKGNIKPQYLAAFLNNKAEAQRGAGNNACIQILEEAINIQPNPKTKKQWQDKLSLWQIDTDRPFSATGNSK